MPFTPGTLNYPTSLDSVVSLFEATDNAATTLNGGINNAVTTITVVSTTLFPSSGSITIESEIIYYTGKSGTTFTGCIRGSAGTSAASHSDLLAVNGRTLAEHHNILALAIVAIETKIGLITVARTDAGQTFTGTQAFGALTASGTLIQTSTSSGAIASGPNGATNPIWQLDNSIASADTGLKLTGSAAGSFTGATLTVISTGANEPLRLISKGTQGIMISSTGTPSYAVTVAAGGAIRIDPMILGSSANGSKTGVMLGNAQFFSWTSGSNWYDAAADTALYRNGVNTAEVNNGTAGQWGALKCGVRDAGTNTSVIGLTLGHQTSGTQANNVAGLGIGILFNINSKTVVDSNAAKISALWTDATEASAAADLVFYTRTGGAAVAEAFRLTGGLQAIHAGIPRFNGTNSTGAGTALLGANCPAITLTAPYTWLTVITQDGSTGYIAVFK